MSDVEALKSVGWLVLDDKTRVRIGRSLSVVSVALGMSGILAVAVMERWDFLVNDFVLSNGAQAIGFGALAWVVLAAQPRNGAVWALAWSAVFSSIYAAGDAVSIWLARGSISDLTLVTLQAHSPSELSRAAAIANWPVTWSWIPGGFLTLTFGLLLFPDGRLPARRWRSVGWLSIATIGMMSVATAWLFRPTSTFAYGAFATGDVAGVADLVARAGFFLMPVVALVCVAAVAVRYRRSSSEVRHQIRVIALGGFCFVGGAAGAVIVDVTISGTSGTNTHPLESIFWFVGQTLFVLSFVVAILKYRLYDIDVVISKSVTYLGLIAAITVVYIAVVVAPLLLIGDGEASDPGIALPITATAVVAVLFEPARRWLRRRTDRLVFGQRTTPHEVLSEVTARLPRAGDASTEELARLLAAGTGANEATVWLRIGGDLYPRGTWPPDPSQEITPVPVEALTGGDRLDLVPVRRGDEMLGAISIVKPADDPVNPADTSLLADVADGAALTLRKIGLDAGLENQARQLQASRQRLVAAHDEERHRLERDLHDGAQQHVVALKVKLGLAKMVATSVGAERVGEAIGDLADRCQEAIEELRAIAHGIYPPLLEAEGLAPALASAAGRANLDVDLQVSELSRLPRPVEETVYFCVLAILEQAQGAGAGHVDIAIDANGAQLTLSATADAVKAELDSTDIADRVGAAEGQLDTSRDGPATRLRMTIPIREVVTS